ncbi:MAG: hypothetical protein KDB63_09045 [Nocardioidaceae bacterium]|nr:hypothetical protein [Nocardioidaceae bacterium]
MGSLRLSRVNRWAPYAAVFAVALSARVATIIHAGGLDTVFGYDQGVYYAASASLSFGHVPYSEFRMVHPPGIMLALLPFAELARWTGDVTAMGAARVAWGFLGATNALLVAVVARRFGRPAAILSGLWYALWPALLLTESTTRLEPLVSVCLLTGWALLTSPMVGERRTLQVVGGFALGLAPAVKIWAIAPVIVTLAWLAWELRGRTAVRVSASAVAGTTAVCLPFFVLAPGAMWSTIVADQLGRPRLRSSIVLRWLDLTGLDLYLDGRTSRLAASLAVAVVAAVILGLAWRRVTARMFVVLSLVQLGVLFASPSYFGFYTGFVLPAFSISLGAAAAVTVDGIAFLARRRVAFRRTARWLPVGVAAAIGVAGVAVWAAELAGQASRYYSLRPFPTDQVRPFVADVRCVTSDSPSALIALDVLTRNLERGCAEGVDVSGLGDDTEPPQVPWAGEPGELGDRQRQHSVLTYLGTGNVAIVMRRHFDGFDEQGWATIDTWPELTRIGTLTVRQAPGWPVTAETRSTADVD